MEILPWKEATDRVSIRQSKRFTKFLLLVSITDAWFLTKFNITLVRSSPFLPLGNYFNKPPFRRDWILTFSPRIILVQRTEFSSFEFPFTTCSVDKHTGREIIKKSKKRKSDSVRGAVVAGMERERGSRLRNLLARDCRLNCQVKTQHLSTCTGAHREPPDWYLER